LTLGRRFSFQDRVAASGSAEWGRHASSSLLAFEVGIATEHLPLVHHHLA
jgi:hypothetical protein